jgi:signal transduction histidine kinase/CheY-like chemotaxis protein
VADPERQLRRIAELVALGQPCHDEEMRLRNGRVVLRDFAPIVVDGVLVGRVWSHRDITELRQAQDQLERVNQEMELRTRQAEAASRAKTDFLANMSHEIRTPMNAIVGLSHLLLKTDPTPRQKDHLARIQGASRNLLALLNDILDLAKIEAEKVEVERAPFNLRQVMDEVADILIEKAREKGLTVQTTLAPGVPTHLLGDALRIGQVLLNLVFNAVKFTESGRISLSAGLAGQAHGRVQLRFQVQDTGIGIPEDVLPRLFQPFNQADASTTRRHGGSGLGLAISRRLVELMGGEITVQSRSGAGSTFSFVLPLDVQEGRTQEPAPVPDRTGGLFPGRVLLAEDNEINRLIAVAILEDAGFQVETACDGREAVKKALGPAPFDLVLMDVQMPEMDGLDATARIHAILPDLPIIAVTAHALESERLRCLDAGMNDHLSKPFEPEELIQRLDWWIRRTAPSRTGSRSLPSGLEKGDPEAVGLLAELGRQLRRHSLRARDTAELLRPSLGGLPAFQRMERAVKGLDFPGALKALDELRLDSALPRA